MISLQKKIRITKRSHSSHTFSHQNAIRYGPPTLQKMNINETIGEDLSKKPKGLKKYNRNQKSLLTDDKKQSYFDLELRRGELNYFKRFRSLRYLENFNSKKNMYSIWQEQTVSKLHQQIGKLKKQKQLLKTKKKELIIFCQ